MISDDRIEFHEFNTLNRTFYRDLLKNYRLSDTVDFRDVGDGII